MVLWERKRLANDNSIYCTFHRLHHGQAVFPHQADRTIHREFAAREKRMKKELKQCPFCGSEAYVQHFPLSDTYEIRCSKCGIGTWPETDRAKAVEKWNKRKH